MVKFTTSLFSIFAATCLVAAAPTSPPTDVILTAESTNTTISEFDHPLDARKSPVTCNSNLDKDTVASVRNARLRTSDHES